MKKFIIALILMSPLVTVTADAGSRCCDGTYSSSEGSGTCSWHGGVCESSTNLGLIYSEGRQRLWNLSMEQAALQAESDCIQGISCDYDIIARARRIFNCKFEDGQKYVCSISYAEEVSITEGLITLANIHGPDNAYEIVTKSAILDAKFLPEENTVILFDESNSVFYIFRGKRRNVVDRLDQEQYDRMLDYWNRKI